MVLKFPCGRSAEELVPVDAAHLVWAVSLGNVDWNPHPVRRADLDHPDELRVDLDPMPGAPWDAVRRVAMVARDVLAEHGLRGYPKTWGSRGIHIPVRIEQRWDFMTVRRAALALAREVERRGGPRHVEVVEGGAPARAVFVDYNQNAKDHTVASAYSVRPVPDARVSCPLEWDEVPDFEPGDFRLDTVPARLRRGDPSAATSTQRRLAGRLLDLATSETRSGGSTCTPRALGPTRSGARRRSRPGAGVPGGGASPGPAGGGGGGGGRDRVAGVPAGVGWSWRRCGRARLDPLPADVVQVNSFRGSPYRGPARGFARSSRRRWCLRTRLG